MREYYVYIHLNKINHKMYIGLTKLNPESRWGLNGINYKGKCSRFWNAIQKYGWDNFEHIIYANHLTKEEACEMEKELIKYYNTQNRSCGYNIMEGGKAPSIPEEVRKRMSISKRGNKNGLGKPCSSEKAKKISDAQKGRRLTEEHKRKLSEAAKRRHTPCSDEKKKCLSDSYPNKKKVLCVELNEVFDSTRLCARQLNLQATLIVKVCKGKAKSTGGYHFKYFDDVINA